MVVVAWQAVLDGKENNSVVDGWLSTWAQFSRRLCVSWGGESPSLIYSLIYYTFSFQYSVDQEPFIGHRYRGFFVRIYMLSLLYPVCLILCIVYTYW